MNATPPSPSVYAEDFTPGQILELGDHTVSKAELVDFATRWDAQWFHIDEEAADQGHFRGLIASGVHTIAIAQRLLTQTVLNQWAVIAGLGFDRVRFPVPVRPGNVLTGTVRRLQLTHGRTSPERATVPPYIDEATFISYPQVSVGRDDPTSRRWLKVVKPPSERVR